MSGQKDSPNRASSKTKLDDDEQNEPLDLSIKRPRTSRQTFDEYQSLLRPTTSNQQSNLISIEKKNQFKTPLNGNSWGCLQFYENSKLVLSHELWNYEPIRITAKTLLSLEPNQIDDNSNLIMNYTDWEHVIGDGFILKRETGDKSIINMQRLDNSKHANKYKIFSNDKQILINTNNVYEIYNGNNVLNNLDQIKDIKGLYEMSKSCHVIIGIYGDFMKAYGQLFTLDDLCKEMMPSYPYWFILKLNPEYLLIDKHAKNLIN